jgi:hypothetical protein
MNTAFGDPTPCADFSWSPIVTNYNLSLVSPIIDASAWTCADIFCDFDLKLIDRNATGTEMLNLEVNVGGVWTGKAAFGDSGSYDWSLKHVNITSVLGKGFQVRFRANGPNSGNILHWYVDNIHIYGVCKAPTLLTGKQNQFVTSLTWHAPKCPAACTLGQYKYDNGTADDGYTNNTAGTWQIGNYFPIAAGASGIIKSLDMYFSSNANSSAQSCVVVFYKADQTTIFGQSPAFTNTGDTWPAGTWVNVPCPDIPYNGPFYAMVDYSGYTALPMKNFLDLDATTVQNGFPLGIGFANVGGTFSPAVTAYGNLDPMVNFLQRANVCAAGKDKDAPITTIDPSTMPNYKVLPRQEGAVNAGVVKGNHSTGPQPRTYSDSPEGSQKLGYNVYRTYDNLLNGSFFKVNTGYVQDTTFTETHASTTEAMQWKYYVTVVFQDSLHPGQILCQPTSDTILITFPTVGINDLTNNSVSLYPNPANDVVNVVSTNDIKTIEVLNYIGQTVYSNKNVNLKTLQLNVTGFTAGVYFVKVTTASGIKTTKITVTH